MWKYNAVYCFSGVRADPETDNRGALPMPLWMGAPTSPLTSATVSSNLLFTRLSGVSKSRKCVFENSPQESSGTTRPQALADTGTDLSPKQNVALFLKGNCSKTIANNN